MDGQRFDEIARLLAGRTSRRRVLKTLAASAGAGLLARAGVGEAAAKTCRRNRDCPSPAPRCEVTSGICCAPRDGVSNHTCCGLDQVESEAGLTSEGTFYQCCPAGSDSQALDFKSEDRPRCCAEGTTCRAADKCCRPGEVCAAGDGGKGRCCPAGSGATTCNGKCCPDGGVCATGDGKKRCCPAGSKAGLFNGKCCPGDSVVATAPGGKQQCCPAGSKPNLVNGNCCPVENVAAGDGSSEVCCLPGSKLQLVAGKCCPEGNVDAQDDGGRHLCCPSGSGNALCGGKCCGADRQCCNGKCCAAGRGCNENGDCAACPDGSHACGGGCCPDGQICCQHVCCAAGAACDGGGGSCGSTCGSGPWALVVSGGADPAKGIYVDDNFTLSLNGQTVAEDFGPAGTRNPVGLTAGNGAVIHVLARDTYGHAHEIDPLSLHRTCDGATQVLDAAGLPYVTDLAPGSNTPFYDKTFTVAF